MKKIAKFEKVSLQQFKKDCIFDVLNVEEIYERINLPIRATKYSAGYDFVTPFEITLKPKEEIIVPTGIRAKIDGDYVLCIFPRSSLGFKYQMNLCNSVGIIDADYYNAKNEGHIMIKIVNNGDKILHINAFDRFVQGIFFNYGICVDDECDVERTGGIGSTNL